jgi:hypothetical protein
MRTKSKRREHYEHPAPRIGAATMQQERSFAKFEAWKTLLTEERLRMSIWVEIFKDHAVKNAEVEEKAAQQAAVIKWDKWIHDGPASDLRRQHQFPEECKDGHQQESASAQCNPSM